MAAAQQSRPQLYRVERMMSPAARTDLLLLSRYESAGASSRVRLFAYQKWLEAGGFSVDAQALFPDRYIERLYRGEGRSRLEVAASYFRRLVYLLRRRRPGLIWLEKELWPFLPAAVESHFLGRVPYVVDIDDAVFHNYDAHPSRVVRHMLGQKIDRIFRNAELVTAGSLYLAERAAASGARRVEIVPTVVDLNSYGDVESRSHTEFTVGWIGSPATQSYVESIAPILAESLDRSGCRLITIGANFARPLFERHESQPWRAETEVEQLAQLDVGIMPLPDEDFERGKCGFKLIQYMAAGVPVVASPVGANRYIVRQGENGFLAEAAGEWRSALESLQCNPELRRKMGAAGRIMVEQAFSLQVTGPKVAGWLAAIAAGRRNKAASR